MAIFVQYNPQDKPTVAHLLNKFPTIYFITAFTTACHWFVSGPHHSILFKFYFNIIFLPKRRFSSRHLRLRSSYSSVQCVHPVSDGHIDVPSRSTVFSASTSCLASLFTLVSAARILSFFSFDQLW